MTTNTTPQIISYPSPNWNERPIDVSIDLIIVHYTDMLSAQAALDRLCDPNAQVSAHYLIEKRGAIYRLVDDQNRAWHAGVSSWQGDSNINCRSIGIELDYPGHTNGLVPYPDTQIQSLIDLLGYLCKKHNIPCNRVIGHCDVAPERKADPGPFFPWKTLAIAGFGLWPKKEQENT